MTQQPNDQRMQNFGTANQQGGRQRTFFTLAFLTRAGVIGFALAGVGLVLEDYTPLKPMTMLGTGYGNLMGSEYATREQREAHYTETIGRATVTPQLDAELQKMKTKQMLDANAAGQTGEAAVSITADVACALGNAFPQLGTKTFCGMGGVVRNRMQGEIQDTFNRSRDLPPSGTVAPPALTDPFTPPASEASRYAPPAAEPQYTPPAADEDDPPDNRPVAVKYADTIAKLEQKLTAAQIEEARQNLPAGDEGTFLYVARLTILANHKPGQG